MILTAFRLRRDMNTERETFGYTRPAWERSRFLSYTPSVGCPIEVPSTIKTDIVKMVEYYDDPRGPVVVERLCWKFGKSLHPYKVRYISLGKNYADRDILLLQNLKTIHDKISGCYVSFASPIKYYFDSMVAPWYKQDIYEYTSYLYGKYQEWIESFAYSQDGWGDTEQFIDLFDNGHANACSEDHFRHFMLPKPMIRDPYTFNTHASSFSAGSLAFERPMGNPFDTSPAPELVVRHPAHTLYSPKEAHGAIASLEQAATQYTDMNLEYILSGTVVVSVTERLCVSRYRDVKFHNAETDVRWVIINDVLRTLYLRNPDRRFMDDLRVTFVMSYGEEALVEVFTLDTNECLGAIHFDLAMLAMCTPSLAVETAPF